MIPTRIWTLVVAALVVGAAGYVLAATFYGRIPQLPGLAPVTVLALGLIELITARALRDRITGRTPRARPGDRGPRAVHPIGVARIAALAKASSLAASIVAGLYGGMFVYVLSELGRLATAESDAWVSGLTVVAAVVLAIAALLLERVCRLRPPPEDAAREASAGR